MITPACNAEAGAATVSLEVMGIIRVTATPIPKATMSTNKKSGLRFTCYISRHFPVWSFCEDLPGCPSNKGNY
jgi:hypothetical protein